MVIMINFGFCYTWLYFASLIFTGWLVTTQWVYGHPTCIYFIKQCTVQCTLYSVLHTALYIDYNIASCQSASLTFLFSWLTLPLPLHASSILYLTLHYAIYRTIDSTLYCTLYFTLHCPLHLHCSLHCPLHHSLYQSQSDWLIWLNP